jgi:S-DNA-T family DNA segregation ATPase FtsK/SpoIIIE
MGKFGAAIAETFIYSWFGIAAFLFPFLLLIIGMKILFRKSVVPIWKSIKHSIFFLYVMPLAMGFLFTENFVLSGALGYQLNRWTGSLIGSTGTALLLLFLAVVYAAIVFNLTVDGIKALLAKKSEEPDAEEEVFAPVADVTIKTNDLDLKDAVVNAKPIVEKKPEPELVLETTPFERPKIEDAPTLDASPLLEDVQFDIETVSVEEEIVAEADGEGMGEYDPTLDLSHYKKPTLDLLEAYGKGEISVDQEELESNKNRIVSTLKNYNIEIERIKATIGPTVTLYEIVPAPGVRISKIKNLEDDIALSLSALRNSNYCSYSRKGNHRY